MSPLLLLAVGMALYPLLGLYIKLSFALGALQEIRSISEAELTTMLISGSEALMELQAIT